jgi:hypothetical protein
VGALVQAEYKTGYSEWRYAAGADVAALEEQVAAFWTELDTLSVAKKAVLEDDVAREVGVMCNAHSVSCWFNSTSGVDSAPVR